MIKVFQESIETWVHCVCVCAPKASPCGKILSSTMPSIAPSCLPHTLKHHFGCSLKVYQRVQSRTLQWIEWREDALSWLRSFDISSYTQFVQKKHYWWDYLYTFPSECLNPELRLSRIWSWGWDKPCSFNSYTIATHLAQCVGVCQCICV